MKYKGHGIVWDAEKCRPLCEFSKSGEFETEDERTIGILDSLGFEKDEPEKVEPKKEEPKKQRKNRQAKTEEGQH